MNYFDGTVLILLILSGLGMISHNATVTWSMLFLLLIRITPLKIFFPVIEKYGLTFGILVLTISAIAPIASGKIPTKQVINSFLNWNSLLAICIGILVSWIGGKGLSFMSNTPSIISGLLIGTIIGVAIFQGVPVGPLIAAGILSFFNIQ